MTDWLAGCNPLCLWMRYRPVSPSYGVQPIIMLFRIECIASGLRLSVRSAPGARDTGHQITSAWVREQTNVAIATDAEPKPKKILVVNDTQEILDLFRDIFEEKGYEVFLYSYTFNDLTEIKRVKPDLVILDYLIGGEDYGWQMLQKLKMDRTTATIPVIICTGALRQARELEGHLKEKGVGVVLKPFDIDDLLHAVNDCWSTLAVDARNP